MRGGVVLQWINRSAATAATLVEQHHSRGAGIEQLPVLGTATAARAAMQKHQRQARR